MGRIPLIPVSYTHLDVYKRQVQGVGFRYTAYMAAGKLGLSGWVANLEDGRVEMEVQGRERDIDLLTEKLRNGQWIEITGIEEEKIPLKKEKHFRIAN